jgi:hypothetical protein
LGVDRNAVHGGGVKIRRRKPGRYRFSQNPSHGVWYRKDFSGHGAGCPKSLKHNIAGFLERFHFQVYISFMVHEISSSVTGHPPH